MATPTRKQSLLLNSGTSQAAFAVTRQTVKSLRERLGFSNETQVIRCALAALRDSVTPRYEADKGPVPAAMLRHIRKNVEQDTEGGSSLL
ncbi:MAG: hypothetical protein P4L83_08730 [Nevskia sp.]|nr:hypothetical protein [Nevskia sp.]